MNLKESFRYQNFLDNLENEAIYSMIDESHCIQETLIHHMNAANPDVQDKEEITEVPDFPNNDKVIQFMLRLIEEKEKLTTAIGEAKRELSFDVEAAIATNKYRQNLNKAIKTMLSKKTGKTVRRGSAFKFNTEGNQTQYYYDIDVVRNDRYDRNGAKKVMRQVIAKADNVSSEIYSVMINTMVSYDAPWDVNESFDEIIEAFE